MGVAEDPQEERFQKILLLALSVDYNSSLLFCQGSQIRAAQAGLHTANPYSQVLTGTALWLSTLTWTLHHFAADCSYTMVLLLLMRKPQILHGLDLQSRP